MDRDREERNISKCLFAALKLGGMTAKELSQSSGVTESTLSKFKKGHRQGIYSSVLQKILNALPDKIYRQYLLLLLEKESPNTGSNEEISDQIENLAYQLRKDRLKDKSTNGYN